MARQSVLILGATGRTGSSIVEGLLQSGNFDLIAGVRPASASRPEYKVLQSRGMDIRTIDVENWTVDQIAEPLKGVDTVISTLHYEQIPFQKRLADASKLAGVKRFVPDDWATACVRGVRELHDLKLEIHDHVKEIGLGHTFIDIGWWTEGVLPVLDPSKAYPPPLGTVRTRFGTGNVKTATTDRRDIGKFVARIIADVRTLNSYVFAWTQEVTQNEAFALAERISGHKFDIISVSGDEIVKQAEESKGPLQRGVTQYLVSVWVRGDNTIENAKKDEYGGALDAQELYPDLVKELRTLEDVAKEYYGIANK